MPLVKPEEAKSKYTDFLAVNALYIDQQLEGRFNEFVTRNDVSRLSTSKLLGHKIYIELRDDEDDMAVAIAMAVEHFQKKLDDDEWNLEVAYWSKENTFSSHCSVKHCFSIYKKKPNDA